MTLSRKEAITSRTCCVWKLELLVNIKTCRCPLLRATMYTVPLVHTTAAGTGVRQTNNVVEARKQRYVRRAAPRVLYDHVLLYLLFAMQNFITILTTESDVKFQR